MEVSGQVDRFLALIDQRARGPKQNGPDSTKNIQREITLVPADHAPLYGNTMWKPLIKAELQIQHVRVASSLKATL